MAHEESVAVVTVYLKKLHFELARTTLIEDETLVVDRVLYRALLALMIQTCNEVFEDVRSPGWWDGQPRAEPGDKAPQD